MESKNCIRSRLFSYAIGPNRNFEFEQSSRLLSFFVSLGIFANRNVYWSVYEPMNFGDWITPYLYRKISGKDPVYQATSYFSSTVFSCGSIIRRIQVPNSAIVWGTGAMSTTDVFARPRKVLAVRGRLTQQLLVKNGIPCPSIFGDPGVLLPKFYTPSVTSNKYRLGIIPHYKDFGAVQLALGNLQRDILLIDVTSPIETVIDQIASCESTVSSSLHGLVVSHAYGIPSSWTSFDFVKESGIEGDGFKFRDYFSAFSTDFESIPASVSDPSILLSPKFIDRVKAERAPDTKFLSENLLACCPFVNF